MKILTRRQGPVRECRMPPQPGRRSRRRGSCGIRAACGGVAIRNGRLHATEDPLPRDPAAAAQLQVLDLDEMRASVVGRDDHRRGGCEARVTRDEDVVTDLVAVGCSIRRAVGLRFGHTTEATRPTESRRWTHLRPGVGARGDAPKRGCVVAQRRWHLACAVGDKSSQRRPQPRARPRTPPQAATPDGVRQSAPACRSGRA